MSKRPCKACDPDYPEKPGILMGRDELWANGWHTHKRSNQEGHMVYKGELGEKVSKATSGIPNFPWEEGYEAYWSENAERKFGVSDIGTAQAAAQPRKDGDE